MTDIADCYILALTTSTAFFAKRLGAANWTAATAPNQTIALQMATAKIDALEYSGYKLLSTQARAFPRKYQKTDSVNPWGNLLSEDSLGYIYDSDAVPQDVLDACCLEALALINFYADSDNTDRQAMKDQGVKNYNLGGVYSETLDSSAFDRYNMYSPEAYRLLQKYFGRRADIV